MLQKPLNPTGEQRRKRGHPCDTGRSRCPAQVFGFWWHQRFSSLPVDPTLGMLECVPPPLARVHSRFDPGIASHRFGIVNTAAIPFLGTLKLS
jgi:hypothetical protein